MSLSGVIFDFNGTLLRDEQWHLAAWNEIVKEISGHGVSEDELRIRFNGIPNAKIIQSLLGPTATADQIETYSLKKEAYYRQFCLQDRQHFHLVAGAERFFTKLRQWQIPYTIASASIEDNMDFFFESFQLARYFDQRLVVYDNGQYVSKVAMFRQACDYIQVPMEKTWVFEDSYSGIANAYEAGCRKIIVIAKKEKAALFQKLPGVAAVWEDFSDPALWSMVRV